jgi:hypothetical protein
MTKWKLNKFTMNEDVYIEERPEGAAPLGSRDFYEKVNPFWLDQGARLEAQAASRKRGRVGPQGRKVASLTNKK